MDTGVHGSVTMAFYHARRNESPGSGLAFSILLTLPATFGTIVFVRSKWSRFMSRFRTIMIVILFIDLFMSLSNLLTPGGFKEVSLDGWGMFYLLTVLEEYSVLLGLLLVLTYVSVHKRTAINLSENAQ